MNTKRLSIAAGVAATGLLVAGCSTTVEEGGASSTTAADSSSSSPTTAASTASTSPSSTAASGGLMDGVPDPSGASKQSTDAISDGGTHVYYTSSDSASAVVSGYESQLQSAGWTAQSSGGGGSSEGGGAGLTATNESRYLVLQAGGPSGETFIDLCVWPSKPSDDSCGDDSDDDS